MNPSLRFFLFLLIFFVSCPFSQAQRDPLLWPFSDTSIWNMPIGSDAIYVPALIEPASSYGMTSDEDILILKPNAPEQTIFTNFADWDVNLDRCIEEGPLLFSAPIPTDFIVGPDTWLGLTPNSSTALLLPDGITIKQTQPFARCSPELATSHYVPDDVNIFGNGITGAHGGSGLSAIGGTLRLGELDDENDTIRHALKVNLFAAENLFYDAATEGYRWPAIRSDGYAAGVYGTERTNPIVPACRMGALLAIPDNMDLMSLDLETLPAQILARAFQTYGAYVVDDTAWDVYAIATEWSPDGRVVEEFEMAWGFPFEEANVNAPWSRDMRKIFMNLHVVDNNLPGNIGGGGTPLAPLAPPFLITQTQSEKSANLTIAPNPSNGLLNITIAKDQQIKQIEVFSITGEPVSLVENVEATMDIQELPSGVYFLRIQFGPSDFSIHKIIKI